MYDYNKINWKLYGDYTKLDFYSCKFKVDMYRLTVKIIDFSCNGTDLNCDADNIEDSVFIKFDKPLNLYNMKEAECDEENNTLIIDGVEYNVYDSDVAMFTGDFQANEQQAIGNILKHFVDYLNSEYNR